MLFVILQDDDKDKESNGVCGCSRHYTEKRNDVGELCTLVRALIVPIEPRIFEYVRISQAQFAHIISILNVYNIEANHDKVQTEPVHSPDLNLSSIQGHWPT